MIRTLYFRELKSYDLTIKKLAEELKRRRMVEIVFFIVKRA